MKICYVNPEILEWLSNRHRCEGDGGGGGPYSPEDSWIRAIDSNHAEEDDLPPVPSLEGVPDDFVYMWHCREVGMTWAEIASMHSMTTAGCWKKYKRLAEETRGKKALLRSPKGAIIRSHNVP